MSSQDSLEETVAPFLTLRGVIVLPIATLLSELLIYGMYMIIFGLCMYICYHQDSTGLRFYLVCTILLFATASVYVALDILGTTRQAVIEFHAAKTQDFNPLIKYLYQDTLKTVWAATTSFAAMFMNALADVMLIHRCYVLWGFSKIVLFTLGSVGIILNGISLAMSFMTSIGASDFSKFQDVLHIGVKIDHGNQIAVAVFNMILSLLAAGRIWWISHEARQHMGMSTHARYHEIVTIILESGLLFPTATIAAVMVPMILDPGSQGIIPIDLGSIALLMAGLAPTLIIVRVAYRKSVDSVQQVVSIHLAGCESQQEAGNRALQTALNIHSSPI
ncbi:hypothetical protein PQX77_012728 [Marasmius sp. AFHP31]|nr:hypothetical protein PQX77_012728 [Marasmius sp. AFHP31]